MTTPQTYKLKPGSFPAQAVELLRFLPAGTELRTTDLCARVGVRPQTDSAKQLAPAALHGLLRRERRRVSGRPCYVVFWMAGGAR